MPTRPFSVASRAWSAREAGSTRCTGGIAASRDLVRAIAVCSSLWKWAVRAAIACLVNAFARSAARCGPAADAATVTRLRPGVAVTFTLRRSEAALWSRPSWTRTPSATCGVANRSAAVRAARPGSADSRRTLKPSKV